MVRLRLVPLILLILLAAAACESGEKSVAPSVRAQDSLPTMHATGINTLISDSGYMRYRMVAEEWDIFTPAYGSNATWKFRKGLLMERLDQNFNVDLFVEADTAYLHRQELWELRGRVCIRNQKGEVFTTEELFWNLNSHEMWSHVYIHIVTPERELEGTEFRSNEQMTRYSVSNSVGAFPVSDTESPTPDSLQDSPPALPAREEAEHPVSPKEGGKSPIQLPHGGEIV